MESLTGGVCASIDVSDSKDEKKQIALFKDLSQRLTRGDAFGVAVKDTREESKKSVEEKRADGLISGHAYGLLKMVDVKDQQLLQLRNPWGSDEWKGAWSNGSKEWSDDMKAAVGEKKEHDQGTFWIHRKDFFPNFDSIHGVRMFDESFKCTATYTSIAPDNKTTQDVSFGVVPETEREVLFVLAQRDARYRSGGKHDEYAVEISLDIYECTDKPEAIKEDDVEGKLIMTIPFGAARSISGSLSLDPSNGYFVVPHVRIPDNLKKTKKHILLFLRCYSKTTVAIEEMGYKEDVEEDEDEDDDDEEEEEEEGKKKKKEKEDDD